MSPGPEPTIERIAHALTPWEWSGRALAVGIAALSVVGIVTVVQRALVADSAAEWAITGVHAAVVAVVVPVLAVRSVRRWRARRDQAPMGVPE